MGTFLRSVNIFKPAAAGDVEDAIAAFYARLGVAVVAAEDAAGAEPDLPAAGGRETSAFVYRPGGDWVSFYPDPGLTGEHVARLMKVAGYTGVYLSLYDDDDWGLDIFDRGDLSFRWFRRIDEPLNPARKEWAKAQRVMARLFGRRMPDEEVARLLGTDLPDSWEKVARLGEFLGITGATISREEIIAGDLPAAERVGLRRLRLKYPPPERKPVRPPARPPSPSAEACDVLFYARWARRRGGRFRLGFYVIDAIVLMRDLLVGAQWVGRTLVEFSPGVADRLQSTRRRLRRARAARLVGRREVPDFWERRWEEVVSAEPFSDEDIYKVSQHIDRGEVTELFADLDEAGSFVRFVAEGRRTFLLLVLGGLFYTDKTFEDEELYERFFRYEFAPVVEALFVKTRSEYGCIALEREDGWDEVTVTERLDAWPPRGQFLNYLGPGLVRGKARALRARLEAAGRYEISAAPTGGLFIKLPFQPNQMAEREFQKSLDALSRAFSAELG